ncbi:unnamed protein product [Caenorhabditis angaria]|uniref:DOMON domain-containing protein n=1 Tax=Caenorhabditis angaria TaxID=860376 RepID=A0A9P1IIV5_9PELO|nr:unnamed protein product [Caenorhabditis angaria]
MRLEFICLVFVAVGLALDCESGKCFGQPEGCNVDTNCRTVFNFDNEGNLDLHLRGVFDQQAYVAFPLEKVNETTTYIICLPHGHRSFKAYADINQPIIVSEEEISKTIRSIDQTNFIFSFDASQLTPTFEQNRNFYITTGKFVDSLIIEDGQNGYSFDEKDTSSEEDVDYHTVFSTQISGDVKRTERLTDSVYTGVDSKQANDAINAIENIANKKNSNFEDEVDSVMEKEKEKTSRRSKESTRNDENVEEEEEEEKPRRPTRGNRKSGRRSSQRRDEEEEIEEGDEDEDWEAAARELERKDRRNGKSRRRQNQDEDDEDRPRNRNSKKRSRDDENDYEEDDEDDAAFANFDIFLCSSIVIIAFGFLF